MTYFKSIIGLFIIVLISCQKETPNTNTDNLLVDETPVAMSDSLGAYLDNPLMIDAGTLIDLQIISYPEILDVDYFALIEIEGPQGGTLSRKDSLIKKCSDGLRITAEQKSKLTSAFLSREECMKSNREILRAIDLKIEEWAKTEKISIIEKFKATVAEINANFIRGTITADEKKAQLDAAEKERNLAIAKLRITAKEKMKAAVERALATGKIKECEKIYLSKVKEILGNDKFEKWVKCHKWHYRRK